MGGGMDNGGGGGMDNGGGGGMDNGGGSMGGGGGEKDSGGGSMNHGGGGGMDGGGGGDGGGADDPDAFVSGKSIKLFFKVYHFILLKISEYFFLFGEKTRSSQGYQDYK